MKTKLLLLAIVIISSFIACNDEKVIMEQPEVEVTFNTALGTSYEDVTKTGYDRGSAPAYISGINITAENLTDNHIVDSTFNFVAFTDADGDGSHDGGGEPISMRVKAGANNFKAESKADTIPYVKWLTNYFSQKLEPNGTLEEKSAAYSDSLLKAFPLYAEYSGERSQEIFSEGAAAQNVTILLEPQNARVNVIFETEIIGPELKIVLQIIDITDPDPKNWVVKRNLALIHTSQTAASALICNNEEVISGAGTRIAKVFLFIDGHTKYTDTFPIENGTNYTYTMRYNPSSSTSAPAISSVKNKMVFAPVYNK